MSDSGLRDIRPAARYLSLSTRMWCHSAAAASASAQANAIVSVHARARAAGETSSTRSIGGGLGRAGASSVAEAGGGGEADGANDAATAASDSSGEKRRVHARDRRELLDRVRLVAVAEMPSAARVATSAASSVLRVHVTSASYDAAARRRRPGRRRSRRTRRARGRAASSRTRTRRGRRADGVERERELLHLDPAMAAAARMPAFLASEAERRRAPRRETTPRGRRRRERGRGRGRGGDDAHVVSPPATASPRALAYPAAHATHAPDETR